jgi:hypothetical protein
VIGLTPDNRSEGDEAVVQAALGCRRDGAGQLERAGDRELVDGVAGRLERALGPFDQQVVEVLVEAGFDDQEARR